MKKQQIWGVLTALACQGCCVFALQAIGIALPADSIKVEVRSIVPEMREKEWQQELSDISEIERAPLIFQANLKDVAPHFASEKAHGSGTMEMLVIATNRQWVEIGGVQVFLPAANSSGLTALSDWLQNLTPMQRKKFLEGNFDFQKLPLALQNTVLHLIGRWYPNVYQDALNGIDKTRLQLILGPQLVFQTHGTIYGLQNKEGEIEMKPILYNSEDSRSIPPAQISKIVPRKPLDKTQPAKLNFGTGQILPLGKINAMVEQTYQKAFSLPQNMEAQSFFVSGQITETAWAQVVKQITLRQESSATQKEVHHINSLMATLLQNEWKTKSEETFDLTWMRRQKVIQSLADKKVPITEDNINEGLTKISREFDAEESLPVSWFLTQRQMTLNELTKDRPALTGYLENYHLQPDSSIKLQTTVALVINTPKNVFTLPLS